MRVALVVALISGALFATRGVAQVAPKGAGFRAEYLAELTVSEDHLLRLAEAIPGDKYDWRPAAGVRSVSEVLLHIAGSNVNLPRVLGLAPREGMVGRDYDKSTVNKGEVIAALRESFVFLRRAIERLAEADGDRKLPWFDGESTYRGVLYFMARHTGEHTGQVIAYARINGIVPPWSERD
ncbi:MAG: DinB family protein [bacterium]